MRDLTGEHDGLDVVTAHGLRVLVLEPGDDCRRGLESTTGLDRKKNGTPPKRKSRQN